MGHGKTFVEPQPGVIEIEYFLQDEPFNRKH